MAAITEQDERDMHDIARRLYSLTGGNGWEATRMAAISSLVDRLAGYCSPRPGHGCSDTQDGLDQELARYEATAGDLMASALKLGGEPLLLVVEGRLGVLFRHCGRLRSCELQLVPAVIRDMDRAISHAREALATPKAVSPQ